MELFDKINGYSNFNTKGCEENLISVEFWVVWHFIQWDRQITNFKRVGIST